MTLSSADPRRGCWLCSFSSVVLVFASRTLVVSMWWMRWVVKRNAIDVTTLPHSSWLSCLVVSPSCVFGTLLFFGSRVPEWKVGRFRLVPSAVHLSVSHFRVCSL